MKIYVASHCRWAAQHVADVLSAQGVEITSSWHSKEFKPTEQHTVTEREEIALEDFDGVVASDALVLVSGKGKYSGGKFVEAGIALGRSKPVVVLGHRENMLLWLGDTIQVDEPTEIIAALTQKGK